LADNFKLQQNNGIQIGSWIEDMKDTQLNDLGKILVEIVNKKPPNIRNIIKKLKDDCVKKTRKNINANPFKDIDTNKYFR
jgi:CTD small phosphatase-like protein 2